MQLAFEGSGRKTRPLSQLCLGLVLVALCGGCSHRSPDQSTPGIAIKHEISPDPPHVGYATLTLTLADATAAPIAHAQVGLEADMLHPGMVPRPFEVKESDPGRYQTRLQFDMAGDWVILLHITLADGNSVDRRFDVKGVLPN